MSSDLDKINNISQIQRILGKIRHGLIIQVIKNQLAKIGIVIMPYYWVQEGVFNTKVPAVRGEVSDYSLGTLGLEKIQEVTQKARGYSISEFIKRLNAGMICFVLKYRNDVAAFMWVNLDECMYKPGDTHLESGEAYLFDMYTMEAYRGQNIASYLRFKSYEKLKGMGREKLFSITEYFNSSAIKYKQKLEARNLKLFLYIGLFNKFHRIFTLKSFESQTANMRSKK